MRIVLRLVLIAFVVGTLSPLVSCSRSGHTVKVVKPKKHYGWFDSKKDRKKKRTKVVKYRVH